MKAKFFSLKILLILIIAINFTAFGKGHMAPKLKLKDINGNIVSYKDLMGKPTILVFWSPNCHSCKDELPALDRLYKKYKGKVNFYAVVVNTDDIQEIKETQKQWGFEMPILIGTPRTIYRFRIIGTPITYVIKQDWRIFKQHIGKTPIEKIEKEIETLLQ